MIFFPILTCSSKEAAAVIFDFLAVDRHPPSRLPGMNALAEIIPVGERQIAGTCRHSNSTRSSRELAVSGSLSRRGGTSTSPSTSGNSL